jgi:hypothetical protein
MVTEVEDFLPEGMAVPSTETSRQSPGVMDQGFSRAACN